MIEAMTQTGGEPIPGAGPELTPVPKPPATGGTPVPSQESSAFLSRLVQKTGNESGEISSNTTANNVLSEASGTPIEDFPPAVESAGETSPPVDTVAEASAEVSESAPEAVDAISAAEPNTELEPTGSAAELTDEEIDKAISEISSDWESNDGFSFGIADKARAALTEAEERGALNVTDRKTLADAIEQAEYQEALLLTNVAVLATKANLEGGKATVEELARAAQTAKDAENQQREMYDGLFRDTRKSAKAAAREYEELLGNMKNEAKSQMDNYETAYKTAQEDENIDSRKVEETRMRYEAAMMHYSMIKKEKRKELIKGILKAIGLSIIVTGVTKTGETVKGGVTGPQRH